MVCPQCGAEYREGFVECADCRVPLVERAPEPEAPAGCADEENCDFDILIRTGYTSPVAIGLAKILLQEAGIPFFDMDQNVAARQESGNMLNWWNVRVPRKREEEAREILRSVEEIQ